MNTISIAGIFANLDGTHPKASIDVTLLDEAAFSGTTHVSQDMIAFPVGYDDGVFTLVLAVPDAVEDIFNYKVAMPDKTAYILAVSSDSPTDWKSLLATL